jgi:hypothetical protein
MYSLNIHKGCLEGKMERGGCRRKASGYRLLESRVKGERSKGPGIKIND